MLSPLPHLDHGALRASELKEHKQAGRWKGPDAGCEVLPWGRARSKDSIALARCWGWGAEAVCTVRMVDNIPPQSMPLETLYEQKQDTMHMYEDAKMKHLLTH